MLRNYYASKYLSKFHHPYESEYQRQEIFMLCNLLKHYSEYTILEAIDRFIGKTLRSKANIAYFASSKVFPSMFQDLIREDKVTKYIRFLPFYSEDDRKKMRRLLQEYSDYSQSYSLSQEDLDRKNQIIKELENFSLESNNGPIGIRKEINIFN